MKKIVLIAAFAATAVFAETAAVDAVKDAAVAEGKSQVVSEVKEAVTEATASEANASEANATEAAPAM